LRARPLLRLVQRSCPCSTQSGTAVTFNRKSDHLSTFQLFTISNRYNSKESKATFLDYNLKKKEEELKKKIGKKEEDKPVRPDFYDGEESPTPVLSETEIEADSDSVAETSQAWKVEKTGKQFDYDYSRFAAESSDTDPDKVASGTDVSDGDETGETDILDGYEYGTADSSFEYDPKGYRTESPSEDETGATESEYETGDETGEEENGEAAINEEEMYETDDLFSDDENMQTESGEGETEYETGTECETEEYDTEENENGSEQGSEEYDSNELDESEEYDTEIDHDTEEEIDSFSFDDFQENNENYLKIKEEAQTILRDYDSEDVDEAADYILNPIPKSDLLNSIDAKTNEKFREERPFVASLEDMQAERARELEKITKHEFRDIDKVFFAIIKEYKNEPIRVWKTLKHEELVPSFNNMHFYSLLKLFWAYKEARPLIPELFEWCKSQTTITFNGRVYHYAILGLLEAGKGKEAIAELQEMERQEVKATPPTRFAITSYWSEKVSQLCKAGKVDDVRNTLRYLRESRVYVTAEVYHEIVDTYMNHGLLYQARDVLFSMSRDGEIPDKKYFAKLIGIYVDNKDIEEAQAVIEEMDTCGIYVPRSLSDIVTESLRKTNSPLAKHAEDLATYRGNMKSLMQQLQTVYKE